MAQFLLLARDRGDEMFAGMSPEEIQRIIQRYIAWGDRLKAAGRMRANHKLESDGRVLRKDGGRVRVLDGPYSETKEIVAGFWLFEAADEAEALKLLEDHPHVEFGSLELRAIDARV
jgi:hypothetical protein